MKHFIRIGPAWLRFPFVTLAFPFHFVAYVLVAMLPARWGGHPNKQRLVSCGFYATPLALYLAAIDGAFVPR